jgi:hypothetical protein
MITRDFKIIRADTSDTRTAKTLKLELLSAVRIEHVYQFSKKNHLWLVICG